MVEVEVAETRLESSSAGEATTEVMSSLSPKLHCASLVFLYDFFLWIKTGLDQWITFPLCRPIFCGLSREVLTSWVPSYLGWAGGVSPGGCYLLS